MESRRRQSPAWASLDPEVRREWRRHPVTQAFLNEFQRELERLRGPFGDLG